MGFFSSFFERWNNWCGDRDMELAIRTALSEAGYRRSAELRNVRLVGVQRPGWLQLYRFDACAKMKSASDGSSEVSTTLASAIVHGVVHCDARSRRHDVRLFESEAARDEHVSHWPK